MAALAGLAAVGPGCPEAGEPDPTEAAATEAPPAAESADPTGLSGTVSAITGVGGLTTPELPPGAFLGKGAALSAGQTVQTPVGTLAELLLADGTKLRLNEGTTLRMPTQKWPRRVELTRGEVVVVTAADGTQGALEIAAGAEMFMVIDGEAQARNNGDTRRFAVLSGRATLTTPSKTIELSPGQSIQAPLPEDAYEDGPELSLSGLDETSWTRTFASAARMTESVPRGVGSLTARRAGSKSERQRLRLTHQTVSVNITGRIAHTEIEQAFFNERPQVLEGIYRFPLPSDASISGLGLLVGNRWMKGEVLEKQRARNIFQQIVDATVPRDPALLEWEQGNMFKLRIFPIPGRGERKVRLSYTQVLPVVAGKLRYRFPMGGSGAGGTPVDNFVFNVNIDRSELDPEQLAQIDTPMLAMNRTLAGDIVNLESSVKNFVPTADLGVDIPLAEAARRVHAISHLDKDGQAYFMLALRPQFDVGEARGPSNIAFVVDRSHSTTPELWTLAQGIVAATASTLSPDDRFTVLACDTACDTLRGGLQPASVASLGDAGEFLRAQDLAGASDLGAMMRAGADALASSTSGERVIVYLGDGAPTSGGMAPDELSSGLRGPMQGTRVLAVALGARADTTALGAVLQATGGEIVRADPRDDIAELVRELSLRARVPMVSDLELDLPDGMLMVRQDAAAGIRNNDTVLVAGKLSHPISGEIRVRGRGPNGPVEASFPVDLSATRDGAAQVHRHLPRTWAAMQIGHLTKTKGFAARDEIVRLSQNYTVLSRFTAMLVLENDAMFRQFNVVRRATDKDTWTGTLTTESSKDLGDGDSNAPRRQATGKLVPLDARPLGVRGSGRGGGGNGVPTATPRTRADPGGVLRGGSNELSNASGPPPSAEPEPEFYNRQTFDAPVDSEPTPDASGGFVKPFGGRHNAGGGEDAFDLDDLEEEPAETREEETVLDGNTPSGATGTRRQHAPPPPKTPSKKRKPKTAKRGASGRDPWPPRTSATPGHAGGAPWSKAAADRRVGWGGLGKQRPRRPALRVRTASAPSARALAQVDVLARRLATDPTQRTAHGRLVRSAIRAGHPEAPEFARAWAEVDPDHAPALRSLADMLAAAGDPTAARAYASAIEVRPFDRKQHQSLARGLTSKGDLTRACSHRHAVVSIEPQKVEHHAALVQCLLQAGRTVDARRARADAGARAVGNPAPLRAALAALDAQIAGAATAPEFALHASAQLRATVSWEGEDELEIVVVDNRGRRMSALRPQGKVRTRSGRGTQSLTMRRVNKSVFVEVTRAGDGSESSAATPLAGTLTIKAGGRRKTIPFEMRGGTIRLAKVFWSR